MTKILVTGAAGLIGHRVMEKLSPDQEVAGLYYRIKPQSNLKRYYQVDLCQRQDVHSVLDSLRPSVLIHCAASCQPGFCEQHPLETMSINLGGTMYLASWAAAHECFVVHVSTDLVFDGSQGDYGEEDPVSPISLYGWSKVAAEEAVKSSGAAYCIVRTALVYGHSPGGNRGADEVLIDNWKRGNATPLFVDEYRTPTAVGELAEKLIEIARQRITGLIHVAGGTRLSRYDFGRKIADLFEFPSQLLIPRRREEVHSIPPRAPDVSMNITKARSLFNTPFRGIEENLRLEHNLPL